MLKLPRPNNSSNRLCNLQTNQLLQNKPRLRDNWKKPSHHWLEGMTSPRIEQELAQHWLLVEPRSDSTTPERPRALKLLSMTPKSSEALELPKQLLTSMNSLLVPETTQPPLVLNLISSSTKSSTRPDKTQDSLRESQKPKHTPTTSELCKLLPSLMLPPEPSSQELAVRPRSPSPILRANLHFSSRTQRTQRKLKPFLKPLKSMLVSSKDKFKANWTTLKSNMALLVRLETMHPLQENWLCPSENQ